MNSQLFEVFLLQKHGTKITVAQGKAKYFSSRNHRCSFQPLGIIESNPLLKAGSLQQVEQESVQGVLKISRAGASTTSQGSLFQSSVTLTVKKFSHLCGTSCVPVFSRCLLSYRCTSLRRAWPQSPAHNEFIYDEVRFQCFNCSGIAIFEGNWNGPNLQRLMFNNFFFLLCHTLSVNLFWITSSWFVPGFF